MVIQKAVIRVHRGKMREFFTKVNTEADFRVKFLENPIETLNDIGFTLTPEAEKEVLKTVQCFKKIHGFDKLPVGYESFYACMRGEDVEDPPDSGLLIQ